MNKASPAFTVYLSLCLLFGTADRAFSGQGAPAGHDASAVIGLPGMKNYAITYWWGPPPEFTTEQRYNEIADLGFNLANMAAPDKPIDYYPTPEKLFNLKVLGLCHKVGLKHRLD